MRTICATLLTATLAVAYPVSSAGISPQSHGHSTGAADQAVSQKDMMWWFPADTESIVAAPGPFLIPIEANAPSEKNEQEWFTKRASESEIRTVFEELSIELLFDLDLGKALRGKTVTYAMQGTRHFREPTHGGEVMEYEGCSVVVFERDLGGLESIIARTPDMKSASRKVIAGTRVLIVNQNSQDREDADFVALPRPNVLLVANNRQYLQEVLERISQRKASRALPDQLPEWRYLEAHARFWGLRHYDLAQAKTDPTSPLGGDCAFSQSDPKAIGVLFALDSKDERHLVITSFTGDGARATAAAGTGQSIEEPQEGVAYSVKLRNPAPGVLERIYTLDRTSTLEYSLLRIQFALGRGMYF